ncbi:MAG TPA: hypothetical protein PKA06_12975, partial [Gemmatales bacterium]|nr:hypothetical protein [Gemmatales bacterium]
MLLRKTNHGKLLPPAQGQTWPEPSRSRQPRRGMSFLEVLTALAIFIFTAYAITQMVDNASRSATRARRLAKAQLLAETKMDELVAGALPLAAGGGPIEEELDGWEYMVNVNPESWSAVQDVSTGSSITGLNSVIVTVYFNIPGA